ncbi:PIN domain-containing protein [Microbispora sp. GKU 823]|uniref:PIN domain-containing protein n=1 Tax=Microbispora sp. GKU 823 TaxID=1652100 RepID=UPI0009A451FE|nr:PIN domain-containing protein [Microbispora sp. GKU 823]
MTGTSPILTRRSPTERSPRDPLRHGTPRRGIQQGGQGSRPLCPVSGAELGQTRCAVARGDRDLSSTLRSGPSRQPRSRGRVLRAIADDELRVIEVTPHDYRRMSELPVAYASLRLQAVDACVIALAERFDLRQVATLDQRDYLVVAPRHLPEGQRLTILPGD